MACSSVCLYAVGERSARRETVLCFVCRHTTSSQRLATAGNAALPGSGCCCGGECCFAHSLLSTRWDGCSRPLPGTDWLANIRTLWVFMLSPKRFLHFRTAYRYARHYKEPFGCSDWCQTSWRRPARAGELSQMYPHKNDPVSMRYGFVTRRMFCEGFSPRR